MHQHNSSEASPLGREVAYPSQYDPGLLFAIPRQSARDALAIDADALPFIGYDYWNAYELSWLDSNGKPQIAQAEFAVPADSEFLVESKSFKLYLNSYNSQKMPSAAAVQAQIQADLSALLGADVQMRFGLPALEDSAEHAGNAGAMQCIDLDAQALSIDCYGPPQPAFLRADAQLQVQQRLHSALLKSNCPVTGQPDWACVQIDYSGAQIDAAGMLRYLLSFREHREFHEQCVERIFSDILTQCAPNALSVYARYTRRGGLDINPWRATANMPAPVRLRHLRQ